MAAGGRVDNRAPAPPHAAMPGQVDRARAARLMERAGLDALLVAAPESFRWATGAPAGVAANWRRLGPAVAVIPADPARPVAAVASDLFAAAAQAAGCDPLRVLPIWPEACSVAPFLPSEESAAALVARATAGRPAAFARPATFDRSHALFLLHDLLAAMRLGRGRIGAELGAIPAADLPALRDAVRPAQLQDATALVEALRAVKSAHEIALLRAAGAITEAALAAFVPAIGAGATRDALGQAFLDLVRQEAAARGAAGVTAWEYVGFGASPWSSPGGLMPGDVVKVDVGAVVQGYTADLARTFTLGPAPPRAREVHDALRAGFEAGYPMFRPGMALRDIHAACLRAVREAGFPGYARGHFGHGLGATIWSEEWPYTAAGSDAVLEAGMVMAFETPFYIEGIGGFIIEDMLLVTETGAETLAGAGLSRELRAL